MGLQALHAALRALGHQIDHPTLAVVSGEAFAFAWDDAAAVVPLRDARALPVLLRGATAAGAEFEAVASSDIAVMLRRIQETLAGGGLALAPNLTGDHTYAVILALDADGHATLVGAGTDTAARTADLSHGWTGSPLDGARWLANPVALVRRGAPRTPDVAAALRSAAAMLDGGTLNHEVAPGAETGGQAPREGATCATGLSGAVELARELRSLPDLTEPARLDRLHAVLGQATYGFELAWRWFERPEVRMIASTSAIARRCRSVRGIARELEERFWDPNGTSSRVALGRAVTGRKSLVFELPAGIDPGELPGDVVATARGPAVVVASVRRAQMVAELAGLLVDGLRALRKLLITA
jgi:hypothetical protein